MIDLYLSLMSQKSNVKKKVLAMLSTVYAADSNCCTYGMNFQHMPELGWEFGCPKVLLFMIIIGIGLFLKQKDWF